MNSKIEKAAAENEMKNMATSMRAQYGFGDETERKQLEEIISKKTKLAIGKGPGNA